MNIVFLFFVSFLSFFKTYSGEDVKLFFSPKEFYIGTTEKVLSLKKFSTLFSSVNFRQYLGKELYDQIEYAAVQRTYHSSVEANSSKVSELNKKKYALERKFPLLLLYAENNKSSFNPFIKKPGLLNGIDTALSSLPIAQKIIDVSEALVQNYNSSIGSNLKIMAQEFTMHNLLFKATLGGSVISSIVLIAKDIISVERLKKSTTKVILFFIVANFLIFHWRKFYYGLEYMRHALRQKEYTKNSIGFLKEHKEKILRGISYLEICAMLIFLYIKKESIIEFISKFKDENFYSFMKKNLLLLNERRLSSAMVFGIFSLIFFQEKLLSSILLLSKKIEEYLISGFNISPNKKEIYDTVDGFFTYIESVLYQENPQIAESDFDSLVLKIQKNIQNQKEVLEKSERTDVQNIEELEKIRNNFTFSVINDVTGDEIKVYDFKKTIDDFILVQRLLVLTKICLYQSCFKTFRLQNADGVEILENDLLNKIDQLCGKLAKQEDLEKTRIQISQTIISLFNIIQKHREEILDKDDLLWYIEELVDDDFKNRYTGCFDHLLPPNDSFVIKAIDNLEQFILNGKNQIKKFFDDIPIIAYLAPEDYVVPVSPQIDQVD